MATIAFVLSGYKKRDGMQAIRLRVTVSGEPQYHPTPFQLQAKQWDNSRGRVKTNHSNHVGINEALDAMYRRCEIAVSDLVKNGSQFTAKNVIDAAFASHDFYELAEEHIKSLNAFRTKKKYESLIAVLKEHAPNLMIEQITEDFLKGFKTFLKNRGNMHNTIVNRLGSIRSVYNAAPVKPAGDPFKPTIVGSYQRSDSEPLTSRDIAKLWAYQPTKKGQRLAKDTFLFSFYAAGMRSGDVLTLKWSEIKDRHIVYDQGKKEHHGKNVLRIPLNSYLEEILSRWDRDTETVFNCVNIHGTEKEVVKRVESKQTAINLALKLLAGRAGVTKYITFKLARTTFADIANKKSNRNIYGIQQSMGHSKIATTEIYLGSDQSAIDELLKIVYE